MRKRWIQLETVAAESKMATITFSGDPETTGEIVNALGLEGEPQVLAAVLRVIQSAEFLSPRDLQGKP